MTEEISAFDGFLLTSSAQREPSHNPLWTFPPQRLDTPVAIKAMAAKLARLIYRMLRYGIEYLDRGAQFYEVQQRTRQIRRLKQNAAKLGFQLVQAPAA